MLLQINQKHNLKELVELGKFDYKYINSDITELPKAERETVEVELVHPNQVTTNRELLETYKFATIREALHYAAKYPDEQKKYPIATLEYIGGQLCYLYLNAVGDERDLYLDEDYPDGSWGKTVRFLVVSAAVDTQSLGSSFLPLELIINGETYRKV